MRDNIRLTMYVVNSQRCVTQYVQILILYSQYLILHDLSVVHQIENNFPLSRLEETFRTVFLKSTWIPVANGPLNLIVETLIRSFARKSIHFRQAKFLSRLCANSAHASFPLYREVVAQQVARPSRSHRHGDASKYRVQRRDRNQDHIRVFSKQPIYLFRKN